MKLNRVLQTVAVGIFLAATLILVFDAYTVDHLYQSHLDISHSGAKVTYNGARILTLNMYMRPPGIHSHSTDHKDARLQYLIDEVLPHYDIVTLQEMFAFMSGRRRRLIQEAEDMGFKFWIASPPKSVWDLAIDGGLMILSRFPIVAADSIWYPRGKYSDWLAAKGALYAKIALNPSSHLHVFTTHTQASYGRVTPLNDATVAIRFDQFRLLHQFMAEKTHDRLPGEPVLLQGDLNVDARFHDSTQDEEDPREARSSEEYLKMLDILRGQRATSPLPMPQYSESVSAANTPSTKAMSPLRFKDLVYRKFRYHPVTFGDVTILDDGTRVPVDTVLTSDELNDSCQRLDYVFWADAIEHAFLRQDSDVDGDNADRPTLPRYSIRPDNVTIAPLFTDRNASIPLPFTQLSDHYGVATSVRVVDLQPKAPAVMAG